MRLRNIPGADEAIADSPPLYTGTDGRKRALASDIWK